MEKKNIDNQEETKEEPKTDADVKKQNSQLKKILVVLGIFFTIFLVGYLSIGSLSSFEYEGVKFQVEKYCDAKPCITMYKTSVPVKYKDSITGKIVDADYNIRLRSDPRNLEEVPIVGKIDFRKNMVLEVTTGELFCNGDWVLALANLQKLNLFGINFLVKNETMIYLPENDFMFVSINKGDATEIVQIKENQYDLNIDNCEVLKATERLMLEAFIRFNEMN